MSIFDSEQILAQAAALADPASKIMHDFANNPAGSDPIQTESGTIISLADLIELVKSNATLGGGGKIFDDVASGLANTLTNQIFVVLDSESYKVYGNIDENSIFLGTLSVENFNTSQKTKLADLPNANELSSQLQTIEDEISGKASSGINGDISQLTALSTALSVAQGGTGVKSLTNLLSALVNIGAYSKSNILGTVSQTSGVPTGAIIESGSNTNGTYTKYADGTLICRAIFEKSIVMASTSIGGQGYGGSTIWTYPSTFIDYPVIVHSGRSDNYVPIPVSDDISTNLTLVSTRLGFTTSSSRTLTIRIMALAVGRWY